MQHQHTNKLPYASSTTCDYSYQQQRQQLHNLISEATQNEEEDPLPTFEEFQGIINDYLGNLSPKKRDKALVDHARYCLIQDVLKNPRNTLISTAQFRFWVKKMFQLQPGSYDLVCHDNKPVAMKEQIYDILVNAHKEAHHGGRDKTSAIVRNQFSWIPKELVARFVRQCPTCISRRNGSQSLSAYTSKTSSPKVDYTPSASGSYCYDAVNMAAAAAAAATAVNASTPALLYTPSSKAESDISTSPSTENTYKRSPNDYINSSPSPTKRPFFGQNGLFETNASYEEPQRHVKLTDNQKNLNSYQIQSAPNSNHLPFSYRRQEYMHYSTYTEHSPSYYNALMNSYHTNDNSGLLNQHNNTSAFVPLKVDNSQGNSQKQIKPSNATNRSSILSHHNTEPQL
ncbi:hypothetical protein EDC94DRAFT_540963 [Helicostylum pulchrum]|nr:hypothetical protein EDC94DRAFT_540963 [Helicostylum pulchrum]